MRLSQGDKDIIISTITNSVQDASVYLFGSRCDDSCRGGDIDLFLITQRELSLMDKINLLTKLEKAGIKRKVDLVIQTPRSPQEKIKKEVETKGICLC